MSHFERLSRTAQTDDIPEHSLHRTLIDTDQTLIQVFRIDSPINMQMKQYFLLLIVACCSPGALFSHGQDDLSWASREKTEFTPNVHHPNIKGVTLFAQNPGIVTPIGIAVAPDGRVFVQENHTHKRNSDYVGPKTDRILVFEDKDKDGIADDRSVFYEGHTFSTDLLFGPDGHLYVSTRWFIGRFRDASKRTKAEGEPEKLIICETDGDYPHNGVGGLAIDPANPEWLAFGFGENLGADYTFVGSDGVKLSGGAEGGSTYRCRTDGSKLTRQSTGHWNAFGMAYDLAGNLFSTDNDPNAIPPNRLLPIVPGADFGFEYRYGRSGLHPLVCWYGENPGTLGMIGALGEAACGLISHGPGKLLSASWTDNRVDFFPTLCAVSGQEGSMDDDLDGVNLLPLLLKQQPLKRKALYWHYPHYHHGGASPHGVIRKGQYRLVEHFDGMPAELYDIQSDIGEAVNLVNTRPELASELLTDLRGWRREVDAQMPALNPNYDPNRIHESMFYHEWADRQRGENEK